MDAIKPIHFIGHLSLEVIYLLFAVLLAEPLYHLNLFNSCVTGETYPQTCCSFSSFHFFIFAIEFESISETCE